MIDILYFDKGVKKGDIKSLGRLKGKPLWIDITKITKEESEAVEKAFNLHPVTADDLLHMNVRIKVESFNDYLFCVFYAINNSKQTELTETDFVLGKNYIISNHHKELESYRCLKADHDEVESLLKKGPDSILHYLLDKEICNFLPALEFIDDELEELDELVVKKPKPEHMSSVLKLKRQIVRIKKIVMPQREKISFLAKNDYSTISKKSLPYFRDLYDQAIIVSDHVENYRESIANTFEIYMSALSNKMNQVMKVLSVIATIALPLTVISSIYGTNFRNLPGSELDFGFYVMIGAMIILSLSLLLYFRKKGWF